MFIKFLFRDRVSLSFLELTLQAGPELRILSVTVSGIMKLKAYATTAWLQTLINLRKCIAGIGLVNQPRTQKKEALSEQTLTKR